MTPTGTPPAPATAAPAPAATSGGADATVTKTAPAPKNEWGATWSGAPPASVPVTHHAVRPGGPTAVLPGFEELDSGGTRFFVELTQTVPVEERKSPGTITYVLKGVHVNVYNNYHALVTVHFNTPVWRGRLVQHGNDLWFVLDLRGEATPAWKMSTPSKDGMTSLQVDFAGGTFLPSDASPPTTSPTPPASRAASPASSVR